MVNYRLYWLHFGRNCFYLGNILSSVNVKCCRNIRVFTFYRNNNNSIEKYLFYHVFIMFYCQYFLFESDNSATLSFDFKYFPCKTNIALK